MAGQAKRGPATQGQKLMQRHWLAGSRAGHDGKFE
jgi:hypothetical protein